jgi:3-phosphoshikimate 1-carboxyvinyltransferase
MIQSFQIAPDPSKRIEETLQVPADKSISHRSIILSSLAEGTTTIHNFLAAEDTLNTLKIFKQLGVKILVDDKEGVMVTVQGVGLQGLKQPDNVLDVGNSGTGIRLILGVLAGQPFETMITGDVSIQKRPMRRVIEPLALMGATFRMSPEGTAPVTVSGSRNLKAIQYAMPVSSAQVKSAIMLAGLYADGETQIFDPGYSRDHTERMMKYFGVDVHNPDANPSPKRLVSPGDIMVPADISSAAFWMVLAAIRPNTKITIVDVGLNPTRTGIIHVMNAMNARISVSNVRHEDSEPIGDITVETSLDVLTAVTLDQSMIEIATFIDEIPIITVLAAFAKGDTIIRDAGELRVKESDRIKTTAAMLRSFGVPVEEFADGLRIQGGVPLHGGYVKSHGDHRIAMSGSIMAVALREESSIMDTACIATSYPGFVTGLKPFVQEAAFS